MPTVKIKSLVPYILTPDEYLFITSRLSQPLHVMGLNWDYKGRINIITIYRDDNDTYRAITLFPDSNRLDYELSL